MLQSIFLIDNRTYPLEETHFEDRNNSLGVINAIPYGVPIDVLEEMFLAGTLSEKGNLQTLSEWIVELHSRPNWREWED